MKPPLVIGGIGGSGTRVVARLVRHVGFFMGTNLNLSVDAMDFVEFYDYWINRFLSTELESISESQTAVMHDQFLECIEKHLAHMPEQEAGWGWKSPRSIYLLPFFHKVFPEMKFIHVIRDGRDMAFSKNKNQLLKHGDSVLGKEFSRFGQPVKAAALWNAVNLATADYGEKRLGNSYLRVLFEDLCLRASATTARLFKFIGRKDSNDAQGILSEIQVPSSIGRWGTQEPALIADIQTHAQEALERFGYMKETLL